MNMKRRSRYLYAFMAALVATILGFSACAQGSPSSVGKAGSLARFAVYDNYLYTLSPHTLTVFDIESKFEPLTVGTVNANENLETIFPYKDRLFLGTREGLNIYSLKVPRSPQFIGKFGHIVSCDPRNPNCWPGIPSPTPADWGSTRNVSTLWMAFGG
jgi:hypothetical protein